MYISADISTFTYKVDFFVEHASFLDKQMFVLLRLYKNVLLLSLFIHNFLNYTVYQYIPMKTSVLLHYLNYTFRLFDNEIVKHNEV